MRVRRNFCVCYPIPLFFFSTTNFFLTNNFFQYMNKNKKCNYVYLYFLFDQQQQVNRPWWPSSLEGVSNSSRRSLKDPGSNPTRGLIIYMDEYTFTCYVPYTHTYTTQLSLHTEFSTNEYARNMVSWHKG